MPRWFVRIGIAVVGHALGLRVALADVPVEPYLYGGVIVEPSAVGSGTMHLLIALGIMASVIGIRFLLAARASRVVVTVSPKVEPFPEDEVRFS